MDGVASEPSTVLSGVPQDTVLDPILFLIFINDLPDYVQSSTKLFATDLILYRKITSAHLLNMASTHCPEKSADIQVIMRQYMALRYGRHPRKDLISAFRKRVRKFRCS